MAQKRKSDAEIFKIVKEIGKKSYPQFICINPFKGYIRKYCRLIEIKCIEKNHPNYNKIKVYELGNLQKNINPFFINGDQFKTDSESLFIEINQLGKKALSHFICIDADYGKTSNGKRLVKVRCTNKNNKYYNQTKIVHVSNLQRGSDPFIEKKNLVEHDLVHPQIEKILKSFNIEYKKEFLISSKSRIDFQFNLPNNKNEVYWIEAKRSDKFHSCNNQLSRYKKLSTLKQYKVKCIFLVDPKGSHKKHGFISFKEFKNKLQHLLFNNSYA